MNQPGSEGTAHGRGHVAFAALRHPGFRFYFGSSLLAMMADNMEHVMSYWVIFQKFESPALGGFAIISHWAPFLLFGVYMGALADRFDGRKILRVSQGLFMAVSLAWAILFLTDTIQAWHAVVLLIGHGLAAALWLPASQLMLHDIVGRESLQSAVRLNSTARHLAILLGPALGGGIMLLLGPGVGLIVNVFVYLPMVIWSFRAPYTGHGREAVGDRPAARFGIMDAFKSVRGLANSRIILVMVALAGFSALFVGGAYMAQMPQFARDLLDEDSQFLYTMLLLANGAGGVVAGLALESFARLQPTARTAVVLAGLWCIAIVGFAVAPAYPLALAALVVAGFMHLSFSTMAQTIVQLEAPAEHRGRIIGLYNMSAQGLRVGGGVTVGLLGAIIGIHWSLGLSALMLLVVTIGLFALAKAYSPAAHAVRPVLAPPTE